MRLPRMSTRRWMTAVVVVAIAAWGFRTQGHHALAWAAPMFGASFAMWAVDKPHRLVAGILGGAITGAVLAMGVGIGGKVAGSILATDPSIGGTVAGGIVGLFAGWVAMVGSCMLRSYPLSESADACMSRERA